jgi:hypothetical protein
LNRLGWLRSSLNSISQADDLVNVLSPDIFQCPVERETVAVNI